MLRSWEVSRVRRTQRPQARRPSRRRLMLRLVRRVRRRAMKVLNMETVVMGSVAAEVGRGVEIHFLERQIAPRVHGRRTPRIGATLRRSLGSER